MTYLARPRACPLTRNPCTTLQEDPPPLLANSWGVILKFLGDILCELFDLPLYLIIYNRMKSNIHIINIYREVSLSHILSQMGHHVKSKLNPRTCIELSHKTRNFVP